MASPRIKKVFLYELETWHLPYSISFLYNYFNLRFHQNLNAPEHLSEDSHRDSVSDYINLAFIDHGKV